MDQFLATVEGLDKGRIASTVLNSIENKKAKGEKRGENFEIQVVSGPIFRGSLGVLYLR